MAAADAPGKSVDVSIKVQDGETSKVLDNDGKKLDSSNVAGCGSRPMSVETQELETAWRSKSFVKVSESSFSSDSTQSSIQSTHELHSTDDLKIHRERLERFQKLAETVKPEHIVPTNNEGDWESAHDLIMVALMPWRPQFPKARAIGIIIANKVHARGVVVEDESAAGVMGEIGRVWIRYSGSDAGGVVVGPRKVETSFTTFATLCQAIAAEANHLIDKRNSASSAPDQVPPA